METAIAQVAEGGEVVLGDDIDLTEVLWVSKDVTIDLGEYDIDSTSDFSISAYNGANVTLKGTGVVTTSGRVAVMARGGATITIEGGTYNGEINAYRDAEIVINDADVTGTSGYPVYAQEGGKVTINGGTFTDNDSAVVSCCGSELTINGGTFTAPYGVAIAARSSCSAGEVTVNDGTFTCGTAKVWAPAGVTVTDYFTEIGGTWTVG